jgi:ketosteroid isomerase-like protein
MTAFLKPWKALTMSAESFEQSGDRVMVKVRQAGTVRETGRPLGIEYFQVWTFQGDSVVRVEAILSESRARRAAGLEGGRPG